MIASRGSVDGEGKRAVGKVQLANTREVAAKLCTIHNFARCVALGRQGPIGARPCGSLLLWARRSDGAASKAVRRARNARWIRERSGRSRTRKAGRGAAGPRGGLGCLGCLGCRWCFALSYGWPPDNGVAASYDGGVKLVWNHVSRSNHYRFFRPRPRSVAACVIIRRTSASQPPLAEPLRRLGSRLFALPLRRFLIHSLPGRGHNVVGEFQVEHFQALDLVA